MGVTKKDQGEAESVIEAEISKITGSLMAGAVFRSFGPSVIVGRRCFIEREKSLFDDLLSALCVNYIRERL